MKYILGAVLLTLFLLAGGLLGWVSCENEDAAEDDTSTVQPIYEEETPSPAPEETSPEVVQYPSEPLPDTGGPKLRLL